MASLDDGTGELLATMHGAILEGVEGKRFELDALWYVLCDGSSELTRAIVDSDGLMIATGFHGISWHGIVAEVGNDLYVSGGIKAKLGSLGQTGSMVKGGQRWVVRNRKCHWGRYRRHNVSGMLCLIILVACSTNLVDLFF